MADVTFAFEAVSHTFPVPASPVQITPHIPSSSLQTGDGLYGYKLGTLWYEYRFTFTRLSAAEVTNLESFFDSTVEGMTNEWTYTDPDGDTHTARFLSAPQITKVANSAYMATVQLRLSGRYS